MKVSLPILIGCVALFALTQPACVPSASSDSSSRSKPEEVAARPVAKPQSKPQEKELPTVAQAAGKLIPREVLFGNPDKASPRISPDGARLAYLAPMDGLLNVWVGSP